MRYYWDKNDFARSLNKLIKITEKETDIRKKNYYLKVLDACNNVYFAFYSNCKSNIRMTNNNHLISITDNLTAFSRYVSIVSEFYFKLYDLKDTLEYIDDRIFELQNATKKGIIRTSAYITHEDTINLTRLFYKDFDSELSEAFKELYDQRYRSIRFSNPHTNYFRDEPSSGDCVFIDGVRQNFITIQNRCGSGKYYDSVHESGHAIANLINPASAYEMEEDFLAEVESMFPEIICMTEQNDEKKQLERDYTSFAALYHMIDTANNILLQKALVDAWEEFDFNINKEYFKYLKEQYSIDQNSFNIIKNCDLTFNGQYVISYYVSMELLYLYKRDKNKALNIYKKIIKAPTGFERLIIAQTELNLGEGIKEEATEIVNNLKLSLDKRNIKI